MKKIVKVLVITIIGVFVLLGSNSIKAEEVETTSGAVEEITQGKCGDNLTWTYNQETKMLSITGTGDMYDKFFYDYDDYLCDVEIVEIGKDVDYVAQFAFKLVNKNAIVKIYGDMDNFEKDSLQSVRSIKLYGNAKTLGRATMGWCLKEVTKSKSNKKIKIKDNMVLSADGKKIIRYFGKEKKIDISDKITVIGEYAFYYRRIKSINMGENVKKINEGAFACCNTLKKVNFNDKLQKIGKYAFCHTNYYSTIKKIELPEKVRVKRAAFMDTPVEKIVVPNSAKIGVTAFSAETTVTTNDEFEGITTTISEANYIPGKKNNNPMTLKWSKVEGAEGYEVVLEQGDTEIKWRQKKNSKIMKTDKLTFVKDYYYYLYLGDTHGEKPENPIYIKVRAYKTINGKTVYTQWTKRKIVECYGVAV